MENRLVKGVFWSVIEVAIKRSLDLIVKLILARLLFPEDFGIIGIATVFISFIQVFNDAGMGPAIIQFKNLTNKHLNTIFWTNIFWSTTLYIILSFIVAPLAALFYKQPLLVNVIPILSLTILTNALNTVHFSQLRKNLDFKKIAFIRNISTLFAGITSIAMAFLGFGIWSLIANTIVAAAISVPLFYKATKWIPKLEWDKNKLRQILSFGIFITGSKVIMNLIGSADMILLGKWVNTSAVGIYTLAFMFTTSVSSQITTMFDTVMFPFYSSIQEDLHKIKNYYKKLIRYYSIFIYPIMLTLLVFADEIIPLLFGIKWVEAILPTKILALAVMVSILTSGYNILFRGIGKPKLEFKIQQFTSIFIHLPCLIAGIKLYGLNGAAIGVLVSRIICFIIHQHYLKKYMNIKIGELLIINRNIFILCACLYIASAPMKLANINIIYIAIIYGTVLIISIYSMFKKDITPLLKK